MATTTNFGWETPDDTDLVKDGAAAIRTLGGAIDTSLVDLKGGTTGQVLSKASNTDMDFTWVAQDDSNAIQNAIVDAKGDIITATANDTPARLAVGTSGNMLVADSSTATGLAYSPTFFAGKNKIINADMRFNQRNFTSSTTDGSFIVDRFLFSGSGTTVTGSVQTFTPGTAPVVGYEAANFCRLAVAGQSATSAYGIFTQRIEDARTLANQTATVSFWAKANTGTPKIAVEWATSAGSGGSGSTIVYGGQVTLSTSWARYSVTFNVPSISGLTLGTSHYAQLNLWVSAGSDFNSRTGSLGIQNNTFDIWGVQAEAGSTATQFQTATGTIQGELAACQRYYYLAVEGTGKNFNLGGYVAADTILGQFNFPVTMRTTPTLVATSGTNYYCAEVAAGQDFFDSLTILRAHTNGAGWYNNTQISGTVGRVAQIYTNNASASIAFNSEL